MSIPSVQKQHHLAGAASLIGMFSSPESGDKEKEVYEAQIAKPPKPYIA